MGYVSVLKCRFVTIASCAQSKALYRFKTFPLEPVPNVSLKFDTAFMFSYHLDRYRNTMSNTRLCVNMSFDRINEIPPLWNTMENNH